MRKHYKQMSDNEICAIKRRICMLKRCALNRFQISQHLNKRMDQRKIGFRRILRVFKSYEIVECTLENGDLRVLIKSNFMRGNNNTLIILSLLNGKLITCYEESRYRLHHANMDKYNDNIQIVELIAEYIHSKVS